MKNSEVLTRSDQNGESCGTADFSAAKLFGASLPQFNNDPASTDSAETRYKISTLEKISTIRRSAGSVLVIAIFL